MANFDASVLVAGQTLFRDEAVNRAEFRMEDHAALKVAQISGLHNPSIEAVKTNVGRVIEAFFPIRQDATNATTRSALHTGARGDSKIVNYTWTPFTETFSISLNQAQKNVMSFQQMFAYTKMNALLNVINRADQFFVAQILADRTTVNAGGANGEWDGTENVFNVDAAFKDDFYSEVIAMLQKNRYEGQVIGIVDTKGNTLARKVGAQGTGNAQNLQYTLQGYGAIVPTTRTLLDTSSYAANGLFFNAGNVSVVPWVQADYRQAANMAEALTSVKGTRGEFSIPQLPGINFMEKYYVTQGDASALGGTTDDVILQGLISMELAYAKAPTNTGSVVFAAGVANA